MFNTLMYPCMNSAGLVGLIISDTVSGCQNPVFNWLLYGRLPETKYVTPSSSTQTVIASSQNRCLDSVVVSPVEATPLTVTPSTEEQVFSAGYYNPVTVEATA